MKSVHRRHAILSENDGEMVEAMHVTYSRG